MLASFLCINSGFRVKSLGSKLGITVEGLGFRVLFWIACDDVNNTYPMLSIRFFFQQTSTFFTLHIIISSLLCKIKVLGLGIYGLGFRGKVWHLIWVGGLYFKLFKRL